MQNKLTKIEDLKKLCKDLRSFDVYQVLNKKIDAINNFFKNENLDTAVIGLSGGVDSSLVYYLLLTAASIKDSPIKKVLGVFMPIKTSGTSGQDAAKIFYHHLTNCIPDQLLSKAEYKIIDLSNAAQSYYNVINPLNSWNKGQIDSIVRTPALYGIAAKLQVQGFKSIVVGTTNRDEGSYIGFYGKASDGMVDLQPIADLHKSEVNALSYLINVPEEIIKRPPEGNVWDEKIDEDMFGAPYDILEMYLTLLDNNATYLISYINDCPNLTKWIMNIEIQRQKNIHKYKVGSPARYIDVIPNNKFKL